MEEHLVKVRDCLSTRLTDRDAERLIELAGSFEQLAAKDLREVMKIVSCG